MSSKKAASVPGLLSEGLWDRAAELAAANGAGQKRKRREHRYSGELAGPPCKSADERVRRYLLLFEHFGLQPWDWCGLSVALAAAHVPGLRLGEPAKKGRPRKVRPVQITNHWLAGFPVSASFGPGLLGAPSVAKSKGGRPIQWTRKLLAALKELADEWRREQKAAGRRASDRAFVSWLCGQIAGSTGERKSKVEKRESRTLANALSRARKSVSKP